MPSKAQKEHDQLQAEYWNLIQKQLEFMHRLIDSNPDLFGIFICEATLGILDGEPDNPFLIKTLRGENLSALNKMYADIAKIFLGKLKGRNFLKEDDGDLICMKDWISSVTQKPRAYKLHYTSGEIDRISYKFFEKNEDNLGYALVNACELVYNGMPLFFLEDTDSGYAHLSFDHDDYIYLAQKGKYSDTHGTGTFPYWAEKYFMKREHLDIHKVFFHGDRPDDAANAIIRTAFQEKIGFSENNRAKTRFIEGTHLTRLSSLSNKVITRYYGGEFNIDDKDTWPHQTQVVEWLMTEFKLTKREAMAVDIVVRPDLIRGK